MRSRFITLALTLGVALAAVGGAGASATPVGPLPQGKTTAFKTTPDRVVAVTLPRPSVKGGVWRIARQFNSAVVIQKAERSLAGGAVRVTFKTTGPGSTRVAFALTKGETAHAYAARFFTFTVGDKPAPGS